MVLGWEGTTKMVWFQSSCHGQDVPGSIHWDLQAATPGRQRPARENPNSKPRKKLLFLSPTQHGGVPSYRGWHGPSEVLPGSKLMPTGTSRCQEGD